MTIDSLKEGLGDDAKDIRINLSKILTEDGAPSLSEKQIFLIALACGYTLKNEYLLEALKPIPAASSATLNAWGPKPPPP
jgi:alkyl hydroperoxide reductase subunit D